MRLHFPEQTRLAEQHGNVQLAIDVFERAKAMPATATCKEMAADGYHIAGPLFPHSDILVAYKECVPKIVKQVRCRNQHVRRNTDRRHSNTGEARIRHLGRQRARCRAGVQRRYERIRICHRRANARDGHAHLLLRARCQNMPPAGS